MHIIGNLTLGKLLAVMFILFLILGMPKILQWFKTKNDECPCSIRDKGYRQNGWFSI